MFYFKNKIIYILLLITGLTINNVSFAQKNKTSKKQIRKNILSKHPQRQGNKDLILAAKYFRNKEYKKAADLYLKIYSDTKNFTYFDYYIHCLIGLNDLKTAEKEIKKQIRKNKNNYNFIIELGYIYKYSDQPVKAKKQFETVLKKIPKDKFIIKDIANRFLSKKETEYAILTYKKGRKILKSNNTFVFELANAYNISGNYQSMINEYLQLLKYDKSKISTVQNRLRYTIRKDPDNEKHKILRKSLLSLVQKYPDISIYSEMLLWYSIQEKNFDIAFTQAKALDKRFHENGNRIFHLAKLCASNNDYDIATKAYKYIIKKGEDNVFYIDSKIGLLETKFLKVTDNVNNNEKDLKILENEYISTIKDMGSNRETIRLIMNLAHLKAFYLHKNQEAIELLKNALTINRVPLKTKAECKIKLADIYLFTGEVWEATLLYSQVEHNLKNNVLGNLAKYKKAKLYYYIGEFRWAKAQFDILKAATSKFIANDAMEMSLLINDNLDNDSINTALSLFSKADLLSYQNKDNEALQTLDSISTIAKGHPISDDVIYKKAEIKIKQGLFHEADSLLQKITELYPFDITADNALMKRGEIYEKVFKNKKKAMDIYQELLKKYPDSIFSVEARKRFRLLRGDSFN
ncbi:MAG: tetratricopeptide repeat protein [Bacteroidales bacterium]|nr:tetratricopeptide repeat protein [Bacteroidales bacterium]